MEKITEYKHLKGMHGNPVIFPQTSIAQSAVDIFSQVTGDVNDHNNKPTEKFTRPVVQGSLLLGFFGGFHKEVCQFENTEAIKGEEKARYDAPVYVDEPFVPMLELDWSEQYDTHIRAIWKYRLQKPKSHELLMEATITLFYFFKTHSK